jgi:hypothetical protein
MNNIQSQEIQNLLLLYENYQKNTVNINDVQQFFENNKVNKESIVNLINTIKNSFSDQYLKRCEDILNKKKPILYYNCQKVLLKDYEYILNNCDYIYNVKVILDEYYEKLKKFVLEAHKLYNYDLIVQKKIKCPECFNNLILKKDIIRDINTKKKLDIDEAYCYSCKNVFKLYAPPYLLDHFSLKSKKPYIIKILVDTF